MKINVTKTDIKKGERCESKSCAVARAILRAGFKRVSVYPTVAQVSKFTQGRMKAVDLPDKVSDFIFKFDREARSARGRAGAIRDGTRESGGWAAATVALLGIALAGKGTAALFFPLVPIVAALGWRSWDRDGLGRFAGGGVAMALGAWLALLAAYGFRGFPLPAPFLDGVRFQIAASSAGEFPAFLDGRWSQTGWWYYYLIALGLKTPLASLLLVAGGFAVLARRRFRGPGDLWMVLPPLFLLYVLSFHYGKNYGVRYMLPAYPLSFQLSAFS